MNADDRYARCEALILAYEGGCVNHPKDPGGYTCQGVTQRALSDYLGRPATVAELTSMSDDLVKAIYRKNYWGAVNGDRLPPGVDLFCFDSAVNCGRGRAAVWLQHALGVVQDAQIGPRTLRALADASDSFLIEDMRQQRAAHYHSLSTYKVFGTGWTRRLESVSATAQSWAAKTRLAA